MYTVKYRPMVQPWHPGQRELYDRTSSEGINMVKNCVFFANTPWNYLGLYLLGLYFYTRMFFHFLKFVQNFKLFEAFDLFKLFEV